MSEIACSIKGNVKENISPRPEQENISLASSPPHHRNAGLVLRPSDLGAYVVPSQQMHLLLVATTPIGF
jgi:hypothetical protein